MKLQPDISIKKNGINKLSLFFICCLSANVSTGGMPVFGIVPTEPPLSIYSIPVQNAQANSNFNFNLSPYISMIYPEVDYVVTNNADSPFPNMSIIELPTGVRRVFEGNGVCAEQISLAGKQSCILRFIVDINSYIHSIRGGPIVCGHAPFLCYFPGSYGLQIDNVVAHLTGPTRVNVTPQWQDGLWYDPASLSVVGTPTRTGVYIFSVSATNDYSTAAPRDLQIDVGVNLRDKPVFKTLYNIASAMPEQNYRLNLLELIEPLPGYMINNQISFGIDTSKEYPAWLGIDGSTILQGRVPPEEAGQQRKVTITAFSNTGGQSEPLTLTIPVAFDPAKKPVIDNGIKLFGEAGELFMSDLSMSITDPASDSSLKIVVDKIEPLASWLKVSSYEPKKMEGVIPEESVGIEYQITLHVNSSIGGNSDSVIIPLKIAINKGLTPHFYAANPQLPLVYEGQAYFYDFVENNDISPEYRNIPYQVELAEGYINPSWLRLEDNKLIADKVPSSVDQITPLFITIKNQPGGKSKVITLDLFVMN